MDGRIWMDGWMDGIPTGTQHNNNVIMMIITASFWRHNDVICALCVRWDTIAVSHSYIPHIVWASCQWPHSRHSMMFFLGVAHFNIRVGPIRLIIRRSKLTRRLGTAQRMASCRVLSAEGAAGLLQGNGVSETPATATPGGQPPSEIIAIQITSIVRMTIRVHSRYLVVS